MNTYILSRCCWSLARGLRQLVARGLQGRALVLAAIKPRSIFQTNRAVRGDLCDTASLEKFFR